MKKLLFTLLLGLLITNLSYPQIKMRLRWANPHLEYEGTRRLLAVDIVDSVYAGQIFRVGSCNIRVAMIPTPLGATTIDTDAVASGANTNLSGPALPCGTSSNYGCMTVTSILGGTVASLNIARNPSSTCYRLNAGRYVLGRIRFNRIDSTGCVRLFININSVVQDSITQWLWGVQWTSLIDSSCISLDSLLLGIGPTASEIPTKYELYQNFPNPFNAMTTIKYDIPKSGFVTITLFDILGREVKKLLNGNVSPGRYEIKWDAANNASGTYFYRLETENFTDIKKMILVK